MNFSDYNYVLGTALTTVTQRIVPPEFGRMVAWQYEKLDGEYQIEELPLIDCSDIVSEDMI